MAGSRNIIVVGASAGGLEALQRLFATLPADIRAAILVVLHLAPHRPSSLSQILNESIALPVKDAKHGEQIQEGNIYVARPDHHLLVKDHRMRLSRGPRENRSRPSIDALFRSAAVAYGTSVIGVLLTGMLDDGASGLLAIKECGGLAIVQDPTDAQYPEMPESALFRVEADFVLPLAQIGATLTRLSAEPAPPRRAIPPDVILEAKIAERVMSDIETEQRIGKLVPLSCPECSGPLWKIDESGEPRFRCHVGHAYSAKSLITEQDELIERALWAGMRTMEERANMGLEMAKNERHRGRINSAELFASRAEESREHAIAIRKLLEERVRQLTEMVSDEYVSDGPTIISPSRPS